MDIQTKDSATVMPPRGEVPITIGGRMSRMTNSMSGPTTATAIAPKTRPTPKKKKSFSIPRKGDRTSPKRSLTGSKTTLTGTRVRAPVGLDGFVRVLYSLEKLLGVFLLAGVRVVPLDLLPVRLLYFVLRGVSVDTQYLVRVFSLPHLSR